MNMVCPDCGSSTFTQRRYATVKCTMEFAYGQFIDYADEIEDAGDRDEDIYCDGCDRTIEDDDLITEDDYNNGEWS